jgi:hypothetical protein
VRLFAAFVVLAPLMADDPAGLVVWKSSDIKQHATTEELQKAPEFRAVAVRQDRDSEPVMGEVGIQLIIVESGEATLVTGGNIQGASIHDGVKTELSEGDVVHVPGALPRQILVAPGKQVTYLVIKQQANPEPQAAAPAPALDSNGKKPALGADVGGGYRACAPGESSPDGTIVDGYQKAIGYNFMGKTCVWSPVEAPAGRANSSSNLKDKPRIGTDMGGGFRSCVAGDDSPNGTIVDGYRKEFHPGPFGNSCAWEKIK